MLLTLSNNYWPFGNNSFGHCCFSAWCSVLGYFMTRCGGKWNIDKISKEICRSTSVLAFESCLRALSPVGCGYGEKGLWSETNPRAGLASARAPLLDWVGPAQHLPLLLPPLLIICLNKGGWAHRIAVIQRLTKSQNWPMLKVFSFSQTGGFLER